MHLTLGHLPVFLFCSFFLSALFLVMSGSYLVNDGHCIWNTAKVWVMFSPAEEDWPPMQPARVKSPQSGWTNCDLGSCFATVRKKVTTALLTLTPDMSPSTGDILGLAYCWGPLWQVLNSAIAYLLKLPKSLSYFFIDSSASQPLFSYNLISM